MTQLYIAVACKKNGKFIKVGVFCFVLVFSSLVPAKPMELHGWPSPLFQCHCTSWH